MNFPRPGVAASDVTRRPRPVDPQTGRSINSHSFPGFTIINRPRQLVGGQFYKAHTYGSGRDEGMEIIQIYTQPGIQIWTLEYTKQNLIRAE